MLLKPCEFQKVIVVGWFRVVSCLRTAISLRAECLEAGEEDAATEERFVVVVPLKRRFPGGE